MPLENKIPNFENPCALMEADYPTQNNRQKRINLLINFNHGTIDVETRNPDVEGFIPQDQFNGITWAYALPNNVDATGLHEWVNEHIKPYFDELYDNSEVDPLDNKLIFNSRNIKDKAEELRFYVDFDYAMQNTFHLSQGNMEIPPVHNCSFLNPNTVDEDYLEPLANTEIFFDTTDNELEKITKNEIQDMKEQGYIPSSESDVFDALQKIRDRLIEEEDETPSM